MELKKLIGNSSGKTARILTICALLLGGCVIDNDENSPVIEFYSNGYEVLDTIFITSPSLLNLSAAISDNESLNSGRFYLSKVSSFEQSSCSLLDDYSHLEVLTFSSSSENYEFMESLPDSLSGTYNIEFDAADDSGNSETINEILVINNESYPLITSITSEQLNGSCNLQIDSSQVEVNLTLNGFSVEGMMSLEVYFINNETTQFIENYDYSGELEISQIISFSITETLVNSLIRLKLTSTSGKTKWGELTLEE